MKYLKEQIYTIPVIDAFKVDTECPFCELVHKLENDAIEFMLGPSYMEDDIRMETNKIGFCSEHYKEMYKRKNRLGLALMLHTHLQKVNHDLSKMLATLDYSSTQKQSLLSSFLGKADKTASHSNQASAYITHLHENCYICNKTSSTFDRYVDTFFYLWKKDKEFIQLVQNSKGFCLHHFGILLYIAPQKLSGTTAEDFYQKIISLQLTHLQRIEEDIEWFTRKFDYKFADESWKNAKDAVPRTMQKLSSLFIEEQRE